MIFSLDDAAVAMKENQKNFEGIEGTWLQQSDQVEFRRIIDRWSLRHALRATLPLVAALILLSPMVP